MWGPLEAGKGKEMGFHLELLRKESSPADILTLAH